VTPTLNRCFDYWAELSGPRRLGFFTIQDNTQTTAQETLVPFGRPETSVLPYSPDYC